MTFGAPSGTSGDLLDSIGDQQRDFSSRIDQVAEKHGGPWPRFCGSPPAGSGSLLQAGHALGPALGVLAPARWPAAGSLSSAR
eukprot:9369770-Pyramimonas_sp.AAC.1